MTTPIGQTAISGIYIGGLVAVSPPTIVLLTAGSNVFKAIIAGILVNTVTDGRMDSAFNILITSPRLSPHALYSSTWMRYQCDFSIWILFFRRKMPELSRSFWSHHHRNF
ncbi:hypothetical protein [Simkania negevensis]|uniref:hypothetical protein n=1 Tax=Simkania negevensis TaxID=83561 RepID=UPI0011D2C2A1|nr:hypothetical protein [Simkania negevensis]